MKDKKDKSRQTYSILCFFQVTSCIKKVLFNLREFVWAKRPMDEANSFENYCKRAGTGFLSGQGFAVIAALFHSLKNSPKGEKLKDFRDQMMKNSFQRGAEMACSEIVNASVTPFVKSHITNQFLQNIVSGALTGAIISCRNGTKEIIKSIALNTAQTIFFNALGNCAEVALKPLDTSFTPVTEAAFNKTRNAQVLIDPFDAFSKAFL